MKFKYRHKCEEIKLAQLDIEPLIAIKAFKKNDRDITWFYEIGNNLVEISYCPYCGRRLK